MKHNNTRVKLTLEKLRRPHHGDSRAGVVPAVISSCTECSLASSGDAEVNHTQLHTATSRKWCFSSRNRDYNSQCV